MSTEAVKWAMDDAPMLLTSKDRPDTTARHVLQALAEHAHKDGTGAHPSVLRLQYRTGLDRATVQRALRRLEAGELIAPEGTVGGRTRWSLAMKRRRPASDWKRLEEEEETQRAATAERVRRHRAKRSRSSAPSAVTDADAVTETDPESVTDGGVTDSASVSNGSEVRYVTHSASVCNARSAALTTNQPPEEPPTTHRAEVENHSAGPRVREPQRPEGRHLQHSPIDDDGFELTDAMRRWSIATFGPGIDVDHETALFLAHHRAQGTRRRSWPDEWQKWMRRSAKWASERAQQPPTLRALPGGQALTGTDATVAGWAALATPPSPEDLP